MSKNNNGNDDGLTLYQQFLNLVMEIHHSESHKKFKEVGEAKPTLSEINYSLHLAELAALMTDPQCREEVMAEIRSLDREEEAAENTTVEIFEMSIDFLTREMNNLYKDSANMEDQKKNKNKEKILMYQDSGEMELDKLFIRLREIALKVLHEMKKSLEDK